MVPRGDERGLSRVRQKLTEPVGEVADVVEDVQKHIALGPDLHADRLQLLIVQRVIAGSPVLV